MNLSLELNIPSLPHTDFFNFCHYLAQKVSLFIALLFISFNAFELPTPTNPPNSKATTTPTNGFTTPSVVVRSVRITIIGLKVSAINYLSFLLYRTQN